MVEDKLDACTRNHGAFVDRRTSLLMKRLRDDDALISR
jgi:hypothetical protein